MCTIVLHVLSYVVFVFSFTINKNSVTIDNVKSKNQIALKPLVITCSLTDIIVISAPIVAGRKGRYYLTNPQGDVRKLDISVPRYKIPQDPLHDLDTINVKFINKTKLITLVDSYKVFNVNFGQSNSWMNTEDTFSEREKKMEANDVMFGPVSEDDYGNWELSAVYKNDEGELAEAYQIITLNIMEMVPATAYQPKLRPGENFELGFAYPIRHLESCQLTVPKTAFDRFYDRNQADPDTCGYVVKNVSTSDTGWWRIIGVGRIAYHAAVYLTVK